MSKKTDLTTLIPEGTLDPQLKIRSLDGWIQEEEPIGVGGFGEVYKYETPLPDWPLVAGKHLIIDNLFNLDAEQKRELAKNVGEFLDEIKLLHEVSSKHSERIIKTIGCYYDNEQIILFTEYLSHGSIKDRIKQGPLEEGRALKYFHQTCEALNFLHHHEPIRVIHRDIKCDNLLLTQEDNVKLADFGLAYLLVVDSFSMTQSAFAADEELGTPLYTAPEVLMGEKYGRGADIWSLACTLVEMLTCHPPHQDTWSDYARRLGSGAQESFRNRVSSTQLGEQLEYSGQLVLSASEETRLLLDCLFTKNKRLRPKIDDIMNLFVGTGTDETVRINHASVISLKNEIVKGILGRNC